MTDRIPPALREALDAEYAGYTGTAAQPSAEDRRDRARAMAAALRWVIGPWEPGWDFRPDRIEAAIATLEQESEGT